MKKTLILSKLEHAAFAGVMSDLAKAREAQIAAAKDAEAVINEIIANHDEAPVPVGTLITGNVADGQQVIVYEVVDVETAQEPSNVVPGPGSVAVAEASAPAPAADPAAVG